MNTARIIHIIVVCISFGVLLAQADDTKVVGEASDNGILSSGFLKDATDPTGRIGEESDDNLKNLGGAFIFVFKLPPLPGGNKIIVSADLQFNLESIANPDEAFLHKADLYAVRLASTDAVLAADYFLGDSGSDKSATLIQKSIMKVTTPLGLIHTDADGSKSLADWLTAQYKTGGAGHYVFIRLSPNVQSERSRYFEISTADSPKPENRPVLTISTK